ncbi:MAG TPA: TRAM domain-containing protein, partial [Acidimicrobiia bacterium]|nr:TRAM domain-containing protein [Acidimicrobiia bacterium]
IVGFPGETDDDFERTLEVVDTAAYDAAYTFVFSPRPGTPAAEMADLTVSAEVVRTRMDRLTEVVEGHALTRHQARVGKVEAALVEGPSKTDPTRVSARTGQGKIVHFDAGGEVVPPGSYVRLEVTRAAPHWLEGELRSVDSTPKPRPVRIPVASV